ncbi:MAG TPA: HTTM domain-containing protein [Candidatus Dormibacteraeota bacterium]|nr:HTTM domain-containing protein [Candidatus Dormibacteraeota bacterium]
MSGRVRRWTASLFEPVDGASMAVFRIALGFVIAWDVIRYWQFGWIDEYYIRPKYHFGYLYLEWVRPLPGDWMYAHFAVMGVAAVLVGLGLLYRPAIVVVWFLYTWKFLIEKSVYMNHYYLIGLLCFLFIFIPAHHTWSLDRRRHPEWPQTVPRWTVYLLRFQLFIVYFYGAIAKLNPDWLRGEPMLSAITARVPGVPEIATHFPPALLAYAIAYGGILNDALVPILLSMRRTRVFGFLCAVAFHALNEVFLSIGVFSYLMSVADTIFFDPDWPRRLAARWGRPLPAPPATSATPASPRPAHRLVLVALAGYVVLQLLVPLRHFLYPGYVSWTEEGHRFSWHMKLRGKQSRMMILATLPTTDTTFQLDPREDLTERQLRKVFTFPDMLLQYVHFKRDELRAIGADPVIHVTWMCSLNGQPERQLVDPTVDLAKVDSSIWPAPWINR